MLRKLGRAAVLAAGLFAGLGAVTAANCADTPSIDEIMTEAHNKKKGLEPKLKTAVKEGKWVIFVGHEIGERHYQTTDTNALEHLCDYLNDPANEIWLGTVQEIGGYIRKQGGTNN